MDQAWELLYSKKSSAFKRTGSPGKAKAPRKRKSAPKRKPEIDSSDFESDEMHDVFSPIEAQEMITSSSHVDANLMSKGSTLIYSEGPLTASDPSRWIDVQSSRIKSSPKQDPIQSLVLYHKSRVFASINALESLGYQLQPNADGNWIENIDKWRVQIPGTDTAEVIYTHHIDQDVQEAAKDLFLLSSNF